VRVLAPPLHAPPRLTQFTALSDECIRPFTVSFHHSFRAVGPGSDYVAMCLTLFMSTSSQMRLTWRPAVSVVSSFIAAFFLSFHLSGNCFVLIWCALFNKRARLQLPMQSVTGLSRARPLTIY
jgi:hypothetical protein